MRAKRERNFISLLAWTETKQAKEGEAEDGGEKLELTAIILFFWGLFLSFSMSPYECTIIVI